MVMRTALPLLLLIGAASALTNDDGLPWPLQNNATLHDFIASSIQRIFESIGWEFHVRGLEVTDVAFDRKGWSDFVALWRMEIWFRRLEMRSTFNSRAGIVERLNAGGDGFNWIIEATEAWRHHYAFHFDHFPGDASAFGLWPTDPSGYAAISEAILGPMPLNDSIVVSDDDDERRSVYDIPYSKLQLSPNPVLRRGNLLGCEITNIPGQLRDERGSY